MHKRLLAFGLAWLAAAGGPASGIAADSPDGHTAEEVLAAMDRTSTWGHPDQYNEFAGMHCYTRGDYPCALSRFREAARYADKLSQLSIGLMYLNGQGVDKDPVVAFAWVAIAAERRYPPFLAPATASGRTWTRSSANGRRSWSPGSTGNTATPRPSHAWPRSFGGIAAA